MHSVKSSNISSIGYDPAEQRLVVEFTSGTKYSYANVPEHAHKALMAADSKGRYFAQAIRGKYQHEQFKRGES